LPENLGFPALLVTGEGCSAPCSARCRRTKRTSWWKIMSEARLPPQS